MKQLESERTLDQANLPKYKAQLTDQKDFMPKAIYVRKSKRLNILISSLKLVIKTIKEEINSIIESTEILNRQMKLLTSIDGIGPIVTMNMIIITASFYSL